MSTSRGRKCGIKPLKRSRGVRPQYLSDSPTMRRSKILDREIQPECPADFRGLGPNGRPLDWKAALWHAKEARGWTHYDVAAAAGLSWRTVGSAMSMGTNDMTFSSAIRFARAFGLTLTQLFGV
jgi:hypothetical protein